jgi:methionyl aminopeptidase
LAVSVELKTKEEIRLLRDAGRIAGGALEAVRAAVKPGVTTEELDRIARNFITAHGAKATFAGYRGYPKAICASINEEVVHGIPGRRVLKEGDIVGIDVGATYNGFIGDTAATFAVGTISKENQRLIDVTRESLVRATQAARVGNRLGDIGWAVQSFVERAGFSVVRDFVGHGVGRQMHEEPAVPNFGEGGVGLRLQEGLVIAIEPMVNAGGYAVRVLPDGWTVVTTDGRCSAHFEHTIAILSEGPVVLTDPN